MAIPAGITAVTVTGTFVDAAGNPLSGYVSFTPSITAVTDDAIVPAREVRIPLDTDGKFETELAATDDADWAATDFTYLVKEVIGGALLRSYNIEVLAATVGDLDLSEITPVDTPVNPPALVYAGQYSYTFEAPTGGTTRVLGRVPAGITITAVRAYRVGGTGASVNVQNGSSDVLSSDLSVSSAGSWQAGSGLQNTAVSAGASLFAEVASVSGTPTYITVLVDWTVTA